jgi:hypothetical protein
MTVETMRAALETVDAYVMACASEAVKKDLPEDTQRADPVVLRKAWAEAERRAEQHNLPALEEMLRKWREKAANTPPDAEQWGVLEGAALTIAYSHEAERVATQCGVPALARHLRAMRDAVVAEHSGRLISVRLPGRVPGADAAWAARAESHGVSVATLRQRGKELPRLLNEPAGQARREDPGKTDRLVSKKPPLRDPRRRGSRKL